MALRELPTSSTLIPFPEPSKEKLEPVVFQERFMRTFGFPSGNRRGPPSILRNGKSHPVQIVILALLILVVQRIFRQRLVV